jgi:hypothetical protein
MLALLFNPSMLIRLTMLCRWSVVVQPVVFTPPNTSPEDRRMDLLDFASKHWEKLIASAVAVWGAFLGTRRWLDSRRRLEVRLDRVGAKGDVTGDMGWRILVEGVNGGPKPIYLDSMGFRFPNRYTWALTPDLLFADPAFPATVVPGKACSVLVRPQLIADRLRSNGYSGNVELVAFFRDATNRVHLTRRGGSTSTNGHRSLPVPKCDRAGQVRILNSARETGARTRLLTSAVAGAVAAAPEVASV